MKNFTYKLQDLVSVRLGNGDHMELTTGRLIHVEKASYSRSGRKNYYILLDDGMVALAVWIENLPDCTQGIMRKQGVQFYSTNVRRYHAFDCLPKVELSVVREATAEEILQLFIKSGETAKVRFITQLMADHALGDLVKLDLPDLRDMYEDTVSAVDIVEVVALPSGGCTRRVRKSNQAA